MLGLRMQYDRIIIDGPPLLGLPDVFMMSNIIDGTVLIISAGHTIFPQIRLAVDQIQKSHMPIFGFILNRVNFRTGRRKVLPLLLPKLRILPAAGSSNGRSAFGYYKHDFVSAKDESNINPSVLG